MTVTPERMELCLRRLGEDFAQIGITAELRGITHGVNRLEGGTYATVVGITGDLMGVLGITYDNRAAQAAYGAVKFDPGTELDEWTESALQEISNILGGRVCMLMEQFGVRLLVLPPTSIHGEDLHLIMPGATHAQAELRIGGGTARMHLAFSPGSS